MVEYDFGGCSTRSPMAASMTLFSNVGDSSTTRCHRASAAGDCASLANPAMRRVASALAGLTASVWRKASTALR